MWTAVNQMHCCCCCCRCCTDGRGDQWCKDYFAFHSSSNSGKVRNKQRVRHSHRQEANGLTAAVCSWAAVDCCVSHYKFLSSNPTGCCSDCNSWGTTNNVFSSFAIMSVCPGPVRLSPDVCFSCLLSVWRGCCVATLHRRLHLHLFHNKQYIQQ